MIRSRCTLDVGSPYQDVPMVRERGYWLMSVRDHAVSPKAGKTRVHRAVLWDRIGPGPHLCALCGTGRLVWVGERNDPEYLHVDHVDRDGDNNRAGNLRPTHKWCNDNRSIIEGYGIGWERWISVPVTDRPALRIAGGPRRGEPTVAARQLAAAPFPEASELEAGEVEDEPSAPVEAAPATGLMPIREGLVRWEDLVG